MIAIFVILAYDISSDKVNKVKKTVGKYLLPVQKSVFEGNITYGNLNLLKTELMRIIDPVKDGIVIYRSEWKRPLSKEVIGIHKNTDILII